MSTINVTTSPLSECGENIKIRVAGEQDAEALLNIYAPYVRETAITFEYEVPSPGEFAERICTTLARYPYLVAERAGEPVGYAYAGPFKTRAAYDWSVETSIYVARDRKRQGVGRRLYNVLEEILKAQGILNMNACIAYPCGAGQGDRSQDMGFVSAQTDRGYQDAHLNRDSVDFHERMGYRMVGEFYQCGYKFNRWYNMVWMEKHIGEHTADQPKVRAFPEIDARGFMGDI